MNSLKVGDKTEDDSLVVLDEDRLCYSVRSISNGGSGVRTISKALLEEWVEAYRQMPDAPAQTIREKLVGQSDIDRFEYGYAGTLAKMAKMVLGQISVIHQSAEDVRKKEFYDWMLSIGKAANYAKDVSRTYLPSISNESKTPSKSMWHGLREFLYAEKPSKRLYEVSSYDELNALYAGIDRVFGSDQTPGLFIPQRFDECWRWAHNPENHNSVSAAWSLFKQFMQWRDTQKQTTNEFLAVVDRLSIALKYFSEHRSDEVRSSGKSYDDCCIEMRGFYSAVDGEKLASCNYEEFRKGLSDRLVANTKFVKHTEEDKRKLGDFLAGVRKEPKDLSVYLANPLDVLGFGGGGVMLTNFLMRVRPDVYATYSGQMFDSVKALGLTRDEKLPTFSAASYDTYKGIQTLIRDRMIAMGIDSDRGTGIPPDYITVNEFTWFVSDNLDSIKEEIMKKQWKPVNSSAAKKSGTKKLADAFANDEMLKRLAAALRTKPFAILAGHAGTGKSQLVRRLAYMTCNNELLAKEGEGKTAPGNYCMVQVKPNWHDSTDLLGYYSEMGGRHFVNTSFVQFVCKAYAYPETPFFVCLDEMNLAPVEQYFAEYLSAIESAEQKDGAWVTDPLVEVDGTGETDADGKEKADTGILDQIMKGATSTEAAAWIQAHGLTIPKNLFVVGTVNMDETTCQFSRKVLDRAMTLLMNEVKFGEMSKSGKPSEEELLDDDGLKFFLEGGTRGEVGKTESELLDAINGPLANTAFVVAYRFANEYALYEAAWAKLKCVDLATASEEEKKSLAIEALDHVVLMKLLPRIHGERAAVKAIFEGAKKKDGSETPGLKTRLPTGGLSAKMMEAILARGDEYLTFWP